MKKTPIVLLVVGIGLVAMLLLLRPSGVVSLSAVPFLSTYQQTEGAVMIDVRTPEEFQQGHIAGAINIDFENQSFLTEVQKLDKAKEYFVYCRSGNRSGQAVKLMQHEGITRITELLGGVVANSNTLSLVKDIASQDGEYVVDPSDLLAGENLIAGIAKTEITAEEKDGILQMREEEKLAHDVYTKLYEKWGVQVFANIARSEQTHTDAVGALLARYAIPDPNADTQSGVYHSAQIQKLYDELVLRGLTSLESAYDVGATIEDLDIYDLETLKKATVKQDILVTYNNLQKGSRNHLRAFVKNITRSGAEYLPKYISPAEYIGIIQSSQERGQI